jgi:hypothetical protein
MADTESSLTRYFLISAVLLILGASALFHFGRPVWHAAYLKVAGRRTVGDVLAQYGQTSRESLAPAFQAAGLSYPPRKVALLGLKAERMLEVWASAGNGWNFIKSYPIKGASGTAGPKLREGDRQVPEGIYRIIGLNPNSSYHLSMKLNYPNAFDLKYAREEGRSQPGTNIFIHGNTGSVGCLAMGDEAIEELFVLAADVGKDQCKVVIAPHDPRNKPLTKTRANGPPWLLELYGKITVEFKDFKKGRSDS